MDVWGSEIILDALQMQCLLKNSLRGVYLGAEDPLHCPDYLMLSDIFKRFCNFGTIFCVDVATSKYCKFCYASMSRNAKTICVTTTPS